MRNIEFYLKKDYNFLLSKEDGKWFGEIVELDGCWADGKTPNECIKELEIAKKLWIETAIEIGKDIPLPMNPLEDYSGRILLRIPCSIHWKVVQRAKKENVSINQYLNAVVTQGINYSEFKEWIEASSNVFRAIEVKYKFAKQIEEEDTVFDYNLVELPRTA